MNIEGSDMKQKTSKQPSIADIMAQAAREQVNAHETAKFNERKIQESIRTTNRDDPWYGAR